MAAQAARADEYFAWARTRKIAVHASYALNEATDGDSRGVVAAAAVEATPAAPAELVVVPRDALLHCSSPLVCATQEDAVAAQAFAAVANKLRREDDVLACRLLFERSKGEASRWSAHVARLPEAPAHCLLHWSSDELEELRGSDVFTLAARWREQIRSDFDEVSVLAEGTWPWLTRETYTWAITMAWSRAITIEGRKTFVPVVDMLNHSPASHTTHGFDEARGAFVVRRAAPAAAGDELTIVYEHAPNARLLLLYGFAMPLDRAAHGGRTLHVGLGRDAPHRVEKVAILAGLGVKEEATGEKPFVISEAIPIPEKLALTLYAQRCDLDQLGRLTAYPDREPAPLRAALSDLVDACDAMLANYPSNDADDATALADDALPPRKRLALLVRVPERRALEACRREAAVRRGALETGPGAD